MPESELELLTQISELHIKYQKHRRMWIWSSTLIIIGLCLVIILWDVISKGFVASWFVIAPTLLVLSLNWGYWTLRVFMQLVSNQKIELRIIQELAIDICELRKEIVFLKHHKH